MTERLRIVFLVHNIHAIGGTVRAVANLTGALADRHDVEIVSVLRHRDRPRIEIDPRVSIRSLVDIRGPGSDLTKVGGRLARAFAARPPRFMPTGEVFRKKYSLLLEARVIRYLRSCRADVIVGTRPGLNLYVSRFAPRRLVRVAQDHETYEAHKDDLRGAFARHYGKLDALVTVTAGDADRYRNALAPKAPRVEAIPNAVPPPAIAPSEGRTHVVIAAGRLLPVKRYDVLVRAFAIVAKERPQWRLRIYGYGPQQPMLRHLVSELGVYNHVFLLGGRSNLEAEWVKGSIAAVSSRREAFGMTIVEAMHGGLPVVSTDAPLGPREIITDGRDGRLVPIEDPPALAAALIEVIDDEPGRRRMSAAALETASRYDPSEVGRSYATLFEELVATRRARRRLRPTAPARRSDRPDAVGPSRDETVVVDGVVLRDPGTAPRLELSMRNRAARILVFTRVGRQEQPGIRVEADERGRIELDLSDGSLAEGLWRIGLDGPGGVVTPAQAGVLDTRALVEPGLEEVPVPVAWVVPFATDVGAFEMRVWSRAAHAEIGDIDILDDGVRIRATLIGARAAPGAAIVLQARADRSVELTFPAEVIDDGRGVALTLRAADVGATRLEAEDQWDVFVVPAPGEAKLRGSRILDDINDKRRLFVYPHVVVEGTPRGAAAFRPHFDAMNGLSFALVDIGPRDHEPR